MEITWPGLENTVKAKIGERAYSSLIRYVKKNRPSLWGREQPRGFLRKANAVALFKELENVGYCQLEQRLNIGVEMKHNSLSHNQKEFRHRWKNWAVEHIVLGDLATWRAAARRIRILKKFPLGLLWLDSSDFAQQKGRGRGKKSAFWSFKLNSPGRRYSFLMDAKGKVLKIWGGYSPKVYDGTFLNLQQEWFETHLRGAGIFADQHYASASKDFSRVTFYCPFKQQPHLSVREEEEQRISDDEDEDDMPMIPEGDDVVDLQTLTKEQRSWNKAQRAMRARVEPPFGLMKPKWKSLQVPWAEEDHDQDCVVWLAAAVHNLG